MFTLCEVLRIQIQLLFLRGKKPRSHLGKGSLGYREAHKQEGADLETLIHMVRWRLEELELSGHAQAGVLTGLNFKGYIVCSCKERGNSEQRLRGMRI